MKKIVFLLTLLMLSLSCNDKVKQIDVTNPIKNTIKPKKKTEQSKVVLGVIHDEELGVKVYGDTTIEKKKIYYTSRKFEPYVSFSDYKVSIEKIKAPIDLNSNEIGHKFQTAIKRDYADEKSIFAGHYSLAFWGCGAPCAMGVIVDRRNGKIYDIPMSSFGYKFKANSRMLLVNPPDSSGYYDNCSYCQPEIYILNETTKKFEQKKPGFE